MVRTLDARTSQNSTYAGGEGEAFLNQTSRIGRVGLNTAGYEGVIRVQLNGICSTFVSVDDNVTLTLFVVRGSQPTDPIVVSNNLIIYPSSSISTNIFTLNLVGSDYNPVPVANLIYTLYISSTSNASSGIVTTRGPQSFNGIAFSD